MVWDKERLQRHFSHQPELLDTLDPMLRRRDRTHQREVFHLLLQRVYWRPTTQSIRLVFDDLGAEG